MRPHRQRHGHRVSLQQSARDPEVRRRRRKTEFFNGIDPKRTLDSYFVGDGTRLRCSHTPAMGCFVRHCGTITRNRDAEPSSSRGIRVRSLPTFVLATILTSGCDRAAVPTSGSADPRRSRLLSIRLFKTSSRACPRTVLRPACVGSRVSVRGTFYRESSGRSAVSMRPGIGSCKNFRATTRVLR